MKITKVEREIRHKIYVGGYETIEPCLRMTAELEEGDDPKEALKILNAELIPAWSREVLGEIRMVHQRRGMETPENDKVPQLMGAFKEMIS